MPAPANDLIANAIPLALDAVTTSVTVSGTTVDATDAEDADLPNPYTGPSVWYQLDIDAVYDTLTVTISTDAYSDGGHCYVEAFDSLIADPTTADLVRHADGILVDGSAGPLPQSGSAPSSEFSGSIWLYVSNVSSGPETGTFTFTVEIATPFGLIVDVAFADGALVAEPTWTSLSTIDGVRVQRATIDRGRTDEFDRTGTGTATVTIVDTAGSLDPTNATGPYYGQIDPMKQIRIRLQNAVDLSWTTLFRGFVEDWDFEVDPSQVVLHGTLSCVDAFGVLAGLEMVPSHHGDTATVNNDIGFNEDALLTAVQTRINKILDDAGWPSALRSIFSGNVGLQANVYSRRDQALTAMQDAADAEFPDVANVYASKEGLVTFHGRYARFNPANVEYDINTWKAGDGFAFQADNTRARINRLRFNRGAGHLINAALALPQNASEDLAPTNLETDAPSIAQYGWRSVSFQDLLTRNGQDGTNAGQETQKFAEFFLNYDVPQTRINQVSFPPRHPDSPEGEATWPLLCGIEISDILSLTTTHPGGGGFTDGSDFDTGVQFVEGLHYDITPLNDRSVNARLDVDLSPRFVYETSPFAGEGVE